MAEEAPSVAAAKGPGMALRAVKNSAYAIVEYAWPIALSIIVTPYIVRGLGTSAYGVLSIAAVTLGFFGLLDLGIGGAAIRAFAQHLERDDGEAAAKVLGTVVTAYLLIGAIGATAIALATPVLVSHVLSIPLDLQPAARVTFYVSAVGFPVALIVGAFASLGATRRSALWQVSALDGRRPPREEERLAAATRQRERLMLAARCGLAVPVSELGGSLDADAARRLAAAGLVSLHSGTIRVTRKGRYVANEVSVRLFRDTYLRG